jgi:hypothetical protein
MAWTLAWTHQKLKMYKKEISLKFMMTCSFVNSKTEKSFVFHYGKFITYTSWHQTLLHKTKAIINKFSKSETEKQMFELRLRFFNFISRIQNPYYLDNFFHSSDLFNDLHTRELVVVMTKLNRVVMES